MDGRQQHLSRVAFQCATFFKRDCGRHGPLSGNLVAYRATGGSRSNSPGSVGRICTDVSLMTVFGNLRDSR